MSANPNNLPAPPPGAKWVFVVSKFVPFPVVEIATNSGKPHVFPLNEPFQYKHARGFFPVYQTVAALHEDFPGADFTHVAVMIRQEPPERAVLDIQPGIKQPNIKSDLNGN